jgi:hypothetical protein
MSELLRFKKSIIRGVSQHFLREQDRIQSDIDMYNHFVTICVARVNSTYNPPVHDVSIERNSQPHCDTNSGHMIQTDNGKQVRSLITSNSQPHYDTFSSTPTKFYVSVESLEFAQKTLEKSQNELDVTKFYYTTPYAYAVRCLSEISDLMHAHDVTYEMTSTTQDRKHTGRSFHMTYEMTSTITSCIFSLMQMSCEPWIRGCERPMFCRWLWDHWTKVSPPTGHDSTWEFLHTISCKFMFAMGKTHLPTHPEPIPEDSITKQIGSTTGVGSP